MENVFFEFLETYWEDITAFVRAMIDFVKSLAGKIGGGDDTEAAE